MILGNSPAARAAKAATTTVPIVFVSGSDPVADGLVTNFNRPEIIEKLNKEINAGLADPTIKTRLAEGGDVFALSPAGFGKFIAEETQKWGKVIRPLNIKAE